MAHEVYDGDDKFSSLDAHFQKINYELSVLISNRLEVLGRNGVQNVKEGPVIGVKLDQIITVF